MSIPTPTVLAPPAKTVKPVSAANFLAGATKKGKSGSHLFYTGEGQEAAARCWNSTPISPRPIANWASPPRCSN